MPRQTARIKKQIKMLKKTPAFAGIFFKNQLKILQKFIKTSSIKPKRSFMIF